jgi:hypothetical protein
MGSWHCEHVSEPTNWAPGMLGGAITVRLTVAQEIAATVAVRTQETTSSLRRLTFFFRESTSCAGESCNGSLIDVSGFRKAVQFVRDFILERQNKRQRKDTLNTRCLFLNEFALRKASFDAF